VRLTGGVRDLIVTQNITLDGVIDAAEGWFGAAGDDPAADAGVQEELRRQRENADAFLVGRRTFETMRGYWPQQTDDETGIGDYLNRVRKYVVSHTLTDPGWEPTTVLGGDPAQDVAALKAEPGGDIVITGSITLVHALNGTGLVDEYRLFVYPVVLGRGRRLFEAARIPKLALVESRSFDSGLVLLRYRPVRSG
jgi:dihydrofolate reductase